jgi:thioredoxin 1
MLEITEENFDSEVLSSQVPVLVTFSSKTCAPCRAIVPVLEQLADEYGNNIKIGKVDVGIFPLLGAKFGIEMLPTLVFFNKGNVVERLIGMQTKSKIQDAIDEIDY